jgi:serine/threonine protein kinase
MSRRTLPLADLDRSVAGRIAEEAILGHASDEPFAAEAVLARSPELWAHASVVIDLAYEEFCQRVERGEEVDVADFIRRFPGVAVPLQHQLMVHRLLASQLQPDPQPVDWPKAPGPFGQFDLLMLIGQGASARVYVARDRHLEDRACVVKVGRQIARERKSIARLDHPAIVDALFAGTDGQTRLDYLCMPLRGRWTLQQVIQFLGQQRPFFRKASDLWRLLEERDDLPEIAGTSRTYGGLLQDSRSLDELIVDWATQVLEGLEHAHAAGYVHCDVKPSNILIGWNGRAVLLDLHSAQSLECGNPVVAGTIPYMAPEQLALFLGDRERASARLTVAVDLFGWAATFVEALQGSPLFSISTEGRPRDELARLHLEARRNNIGLLRTGRPLVREFLSIVEACLAFASTERPASAGILREHVAALSKPVRKFRRFVVSHPLRSLAGAAAAIGLLVLLVAGSLPNSQRDAEMGQTRLAAGDLTAAYQFFHRALRWDEKNATARNGLVMTLLKQHQNAAALEHLDKASDDPFVIRCRAYAIISGRGALTEAMNLYRALIASQAVLPEDYNNAAYCLARQTTLQDLKEAEHWLRHAIETTPHLSEAWANLLVVQRQLAAYGHADLDLDLADRALREAQPSISVQCEAAMTFAIAGASSSGDESRIQECRRRVMEICDRALPLGLKRDFVRLIRQTWPDSELASAMIRMEPRLSDSPLVRGEHYLVLPSLPVASPASGR